MGKNHLSFYIFFIDVQFKIDRNMSELWKMVCKIYNIILTLVNLSVLCMNTKKLCHKFYVIGEPYVTFE
jgi:hypothetical protein